MKKCPFCPLRNEKNSSVLSVSSVVKELSVFMAIPFLRFPALRIILQR